MGDSVRVRSQHQWRLARATRRGDVCARQATFDRVRGRVRWVRTRIRNPPLGARCPARSAHARCQRLPAVGTEQRGETSIPARARAQPALASGSAARPLIMRRSRAGSVSTSGVLVPRCPRRQRRAARVCSPRDVGDPRRPRRVGDRIGADRIVEGKTHVDSAMRRDLFRRCRGSR